MTTIGHDSHCETNNLYKKCAITV